MDQLITTIGIAFVFIALAIAALSIGWLITGKKKLHSGGCGKVPKEKDEACGTKESCSMCENNPKEKDDTTTTKSDDR